MKTVIFILLSLVLLGCGVNNDFSKKKYLKLKHLTSSNSNTISNNEVIIEQTAILVFQNESVDSAGHEFCIVHNSPNPNRKGFELPTSDTFDNLIEAGRNGVVNNPDSGNDEVAIENSSPRDESTLSLEEKGDTQNFNRHYFISVGFYIAGVIAWLAAVFFGGYIIIGLALLLFLCAWAFAISAVLKGRKIKNEQGGNKKFSRKYRLMVMGSIAGGVLFLAGVAALLLLFSNGFF